MRTPVSLSALLAILTLMTPLAEAKPRLRAVSGIRAEYSTSATATGMTIRWSAVRNGARYRFTLLDDHGATIIARDAKAPSVTIDGGLLADGERYTAELQAVGGRRYAPSRISRRPFTYTTRVPTAEYFGPLSTANSSGRRGAVLLPENYRMTAIPVMVLFHGSSIDGTVIARVFKTAAQKNHFIILAPDSVSPIGWELSTDLTRPTEDQQHIAACLAELLALPHISVKGFMAAGMSAGGEVAALYGSNDSRYSAFAVFHGGVDIPSLGANRVPVWLSTGTSDELRPPAELEFYQSALTGRGFSDVSYHEYEAGHGIALRERKDFISWWLARQ